jgi:hypothetical protein
MLVREGFSAELDRSFGAQQPVTWVWTDEQLKVSSSRSPSVSQTAGGRVLRLWFNRTHLDLTARGLPLIEGVLQFEIGRRLGRPE